jgi:hypothetical protein
MQIIFTGTPNKLRYTLQRLGMARLLQQTTPAAALGTSDYYTATADLGKANSKGPTMLTFTSSNPATVPMIMTNKGPVMPFKPVADSGCEPNYFRCAL